MNLPNAAETIGLIVRITLLLTPFFIFSVFISLCSEQALEKTARRKLAHRTAFAVLVCCFVFYFFGRWIFQYLGITIDAFRIGAGVVLLLNGIDLVRSSAIPASRSTPAGESDLAVVPLAIPYTVGPGTIGTLIVMGAGDTQWERRVAVMIAIVCASVFLGFLLHFSVELGKVLKARGTAILGKLTGMYITALAAQIIFTGIGNMLKW